MSEKYKLYPTPPAFTMPTDLTGIDFIDVPTKNMPKQENAGLNGFSTFIKSVAERKIK